jgi:hypothetical protein
MFFAAPLVTPMQQIVNIKSIKDRALGILRTRLIRNEIAPRMHRIEVAMWEAWAIDQISKIQANDN